jgi:hypothetical protein
MTSKNQKNLETVLEHRMNDSFVLLERVPLLCNDIRGIRTDITEIKVSTKERQTEIKDLIQKHIDKSENSFSKQGERIGRLELDHQAVLDRVSDFKNLGDKVDKLKAQMAYGAGAITIAWTAIQFMIK